MQKVEGGGGIHGGRVDGRAAKWLVPSTHTGYEAGGDTEACELIFEIFGHHWALEKVP